MLVDAHCRFLVELVCDGNVCFNSALHLGGKLDFSVFASFVDSAELESQRLPKQLCCCLVTPVVDKLEGGVHAMALDVHGGAEDCQVLHPVGLGVDLHILGFVPHKLVPHISPRLQVMRSSNTQVELFIFKVDSGSQLISLSFLLLVVGVQIDKSLDISYLGGADVAVSVDTVVVLTGLCLTACSCDNVPSFTLVYNSPNAETQCIEG